MLAVVWSLAIVGITLDVFSTRRSELLQVGIYLIMGWVCVVDYGSIKTALPQAGINWLIAGGLCYTLGIIFYALDHVNKLRHAHGIWHLFVLVGSVCHFVAVMGYLR